MSPKEIVLKWVETFNLADADKLAEMYHDDAINHQVANDPVNGKNAIHEMFRKEFLNADMNCIIENIFEDREWAILEWTDPNGFRGCGFFHIVNDKIIFQRGYWDKISFLRSIGSPVPVI